LAEYQVPKRVRLGLSRDENAAGCKELSEIDEAGSVELQASAGVYCQDDIERRLIESFGVILQRPLAGGNPGERLRQKRQPGRLLGIGIRCDIT
jgi:hypothetical protein